MYFRVINYERKLFKQVNKMIDKAKYLPSLYKYDVWESAVEYLLKLRKENLELQA